MVTESPNSTLLMWQYLGMTLSYTMLVLGGLVAVLVAVKKNPKWVTWLKRFGVPVAIAPEIPKRLHVEETLMLEPQKNLHIVRCGAERFLIASGVDSTQFLAKLDEPTGSSAVSEQEAEHHSPEAAEDKAAYAFLNSLRQRRPQPSGMTPPSPSMAGSGRRGQ